MMMMMTSINSNPTSTAANMYTTPNASKKENDIQVGNDKKLINLLAKGKFNLLDKDKDGLLSVNELKSLLEGNNFETFAKTNTEFKDLKLALGRFSEQQRNMALARTNETGYENKFKGVSLVDVETIDNDLRAIKNDPKKEKGFTHIGNVYAERALKQGGLAADINISSEDYNVGEGLTNALNGQLSSVDRTEAPKKTEETKKEEPKKEHSSGPNLLEMLLIGGAGFLAAWAIKK